MTAKNIWLIVGVILVLVLGFAFYSTSVDTEKDALWRGLQGKAKFDPYYVTERFLKAKGLSVKRETTYTSINQYSEFSEYDTVFFSNKAKTLNKKQVTALLNWAENGGKIVINASNNFNADHKKFIKKQRSLKGLLQVAGIAVSKCSLDEFGKKSCQRYCKKSTHENSEDSPSTTSVMVTQPLSSQLSNSVNNDLELDEDTRLIKKKIDYLLKNSDSTKSSSTASVSANGEILYRRWRKNIKEIFTYQGKAKLLWNQHAVCSGSLFASFSYGSGNIIVYQEDEQRFKTGRKEYSFDLLRGDNATYLYYLLNLETKANHILWFERDSYTTAFAIIWRYGFYALLSALLLILAWAWKNGKRFGPLIVNDERESLSMSRHIHTMGDFYIKHNCRHTLVAYCYEQLDSDISRVIHIAATLAKNELAQAIHEKTQLPLIRIHSVLERRYPEDDTEFTQLIYTINEIRKRL